MKLYKLSHGKLIYLPFVFMAIFIVLSIVIQSLILPQSLTISPGQKITLSANFPLGFNIIQQELMTVSKIQNLFTQNLTLQSTNIRKYDVQLILFGKFPIKKVHIQVLKPELVIPCGHAIGVLVSSKGVLIVGYLPVTGINRRQYNPAKTAGLKVGDILLAINDNIINNVEEVEHILIGYSGKKSLKLTIKRKGLILKKKIQPVLTEENGAKKYMLGIFIEDPAAGVGTLSFYSPARHSFAGLGHQINSFGGRNGLSFQFGEIVLANISGIKIGSPGKPGEKIGIFNAAQSPVGKITKNCKFGIYGMVYKNFEEFFRSGRIDPAPIAYTSQVKEGTAFIYTVIKGSKIEKFKVKIIKVYKQNSPRDKGLILKVTDPRLLRETGGIVQGMSGSPIIQEGRMIGAVTHVFVNDPTKGYGVLAEWMIEEIDKSFIEKAS